MSMGVSWVMGVPRYPKMDGLFHGTSQTKMHEKGGSPILGNFYMCYNYIPYIADIRLFTLECELKTQS